MICDSVMYQVPTQKRETELNSMFGTWLVWNEATTKIHLLHNCKRVLVVVRLAWVVGEVLDAGDKVRRVARRVGA